MRGALVKMTQDEVVNHRSWTNLVWDQRLYDTEGFWNPANPCEFVIPANADFSFVKLQAAAIWEAHGYGMRQILIKKWNGTGWAFFDGGSPNTAMANPNTTTDHDTPTATIPVSPGDRFVVEVWQVSEGPVFPNGKPLKMLAATGTWFAIEVVT